MPDTITWHRPIYRNRGEELISLAQVASLANVTRAAVSNWRRRHDFPAPAMTAGRTVWVVRAEAEHWLATQRRQPGPNGPRKATRTRLTEAIAALEAREERQTAELDTTRTKLRALRRQLTAN